MTATTDTTTTPTLTADLPVKRPPKRLKLKNPDGTNVRKKAPKISKAELAQMKQRELDAATITYLQDFHHNRAAWRFQKARQIRLFAMLYERKRFPKAQFKLLEVYVQGMQGAVRERLVAEAKAIIDAPAPAKADGAANDSDSDAETPKLDRDARTRIKRAKKLLGWLK